MPIDLHNFTSIYTQRLFTYCNDRVIAASHNDVSFKLSPSALKEILELEKDYTIATFISDILEPATTDFKANTPLKLNYHLLKHENMIETVLFIISAPPRFHKEKETTQLTNLEITRLQPEAVPTATNIKQLKYTQNDCQKTLDTLKNYFPDGNYPLPSLDLLEEVTTLKQAAFERLEELYKSGYRDEKCFFEAS